MKWYYLTCLLLLGISWIQANEEDLQDVTKVSTDNDDDVFEEGLELLVKKCHEVGKGNETLEKITKAFQDTQTCLQNHLPKSKDELKELADSASDSIDICSEKRHEVRNCLDGLIESLQDCAVEEEKYIPEFIFGAIDALLDYLCANEGAAIQKAVNEKTLECIFTLVEHANLTEICTDKLKVLKDDTPDDAIITKPELCGDLATAKTCYGEFISDQCPDSVEFRDFLKGLYEAISSPCHVDPRNPLNLNLPNRRK